MQEEKQRTTYKFIENLTYSCQAGAKYVILNKYMLVTAQSPLLLLISKAKDFSCKFVCAERSRRCFSKQKIYFFKIPV